MKLSEKAEKQRETSGKVSRCLCGESVLGAIEERNDLSAGAAIVGAERVGGRTVGHAALHCPCHSIGTESVSRHIGETVHRGGCFTQRTVQQRHTLSTGAGIVDTKRTVREAVGNAVLNSPCNSVVAVAAGEHVAGDLGRALGSVRTGGTPQEGHDLTTGAGIAGAEQGIGLAVGDAQLLGPLHGVKIIGVGGHVNEGAGLPRLDEGRLDLHLATGHGEGVLAVALVGELQRIALAVQHGDGADLVAAVRLDGDGHPVALGGVLGADGHIAVLRAGGGHGVAAAGRAGGGTAAGRPLRSRYAQYLRVAASNRTDSRNPQRVRGIGTQACQVMLPAAASAVCSLISRLPS